MTYKKTTWQDHVVDHKTGKVIQHGTPQSAKNFNNLEEGVTEAHTKLAEVNQRHKVCGDGGLALLETGANIDLDDIVKTGFYKITKPKNAPALNTSWNMLVVVAYDNDDVSQTIHTLDKKYIRRKRNTWQPWIAMATEKDIAEVDEKVTRAEKNTVNAMKNLVDLAIEVETIKKADLLGVNAGIFVETFTDIEDVELLNAATAYDVLHQRIYLK